MRAKDVPGAASSWTKACDTSASGIISLPMLGYKATPIRITAIAPLRTTNRFRIDQTKLVR